MDETPRDERLTDEVFPEVEAPAVEPVVASSEGGLGLDEDLAVRRRNGSPWRTAVALLVAAIAWLVPGLGHVVTGKWLRGIVFFLCVGGLAVAGYLLRGNAFARHSTEPFGTLGFLADAGSGVFYVLAKFFEGAGPDVSRAAGDYGTRFIAAAGVVNFLGVFDAYEIAAGRRT